MTNPEIIRRHDLGNVIEITNEHGTKLFIFPTDITTIQPRLSGVLINIKGMNDVFHVGNCGDLKSNIKLAEILAGIVSSSRIDFGVDMV